MTRKQKKQVLLLSAKAVDARTREFSCNAIYHSTQSKHKDAFVAEYKDFFIEATPRNQWALQLWEESRDPSIDEFRPEFSEFANIRVLMLLLFRESL